MKVYSRKKAHLIRKRGERPENDRTETHGKGSSTGETKLKKKEKKKSTYGARKTEGQRRTKMKMVGKRGERWREGKGEEKRRCS